MAVADEAAMGAPLDLRSLYHTPDPRRLMPYPALDDVARYLDDVARRHPDLVTVDVAGRSVDNRPVWRVVVTDPAVADDDKAVVVAVAQEHGEERSGSLSLLELLDWLRTAEARPALRGLIVVLLPIVNPDAWESRAFGNRNGVNLFVDYRLDGPCSQPEAEAVRATLDRYRPEVLANLHGRSTGSAVRAVEGNGLAHASSQYERSHSHQLVEEVARAAEAAGYPQDRGEEDAERLLAWVPGGEHHSFGSQFAITPGVYAYHHYHTLSLCMEVTEPPSGMLRVQRLLQLGGERWRTEGRPGYPVNVMAWNCHAFLCAAGATADLRRRSRQALWRLQGRCAFAYGVPARMGCELVAFSPFTIDRERWGGRPLTDLLDTLEGEPGIDVAALRRFWPRPEETICLLTEERGKPTLAPEPGAPVGESVGLRLRLPGDIQVTEAVVNGRRLDPGGDGGYDHWQTPNGFTMVQADLSPEASPGGRFVMMVRYEVR